MSIAASGLSQRSSGLPISLSASQYTNASSKGKQASSMSKSKIRALQSKLSEKSYFGKSVFRASTAEIQGSRLFHTRIEASFMTLLGRTRDGRAESVAETFRVLVDLAEGNYGPSFSFLLRKMSASLLLVVAEAILACISRSWERAEASALGARLLACVVHELGRRQSGDRQPIEPHNSIALAWIHSASRLAADLSAVAADPAGCGIPRDSSAEGKPLLLLAFRRAVRAAGRLAAAAQSSPSSKTSADGGGLTAAYKQANWDRVQAAGQSTMHSLVVEVPSASSAMTTCGALLQALSHVVGAAWSGQQEEAFANQNLQRAIMPALRASRSVLLGRCSTGDLQDGAATSLFAGARACIGSGWAAGLCGQAEALALGRSLHKLSAPTILRQALLASVTTSSRRTGNTINLEAERAMGDAAAYLCESALASGIVSSVQVRDLVLEICSPVIVRGGGSSTATTAPPIAVASSSGSGSGEQRPEYDAAAFEQYSGSNALLVAPRGLSSPSTCLQKLFCSCWESEVSDRTESDAVCSRLPQIAIGLCHCIGAAYSGRAQFSECRMGFADKLIASTARAISQLGVNFAQVAVAAEQLRKSDDRSLDTADQEEEVIEGRSAKRRRASSSVHGSAVSGSVLEHAVEALQPKRQQSDGRVGAALFGPKPDAVSILVGRLLYCGSQLHADDAQDESLSDDGESGGGSLGGFATVSHVENGRMSDVETSKICSNGIATQEKIGAAIFLMGHVLPACFPRWNRRGAGVPPQNADTAWPAVRSLVQSVCAASVYFIGDTCDTAHSLRAQLDGHLGAAQLKASPGSAPAMDSLAKRLGGHAAFRAMVLQTTVASQLLASTRAMAPQALQSRVGPRVGNLYASLSSASRVCFPSVGEVPHFRASSPVGNSVTPWTCCISSLEPSISSSAGDVDFRGTDADTTCQVIGACNITSCQAMLDALWCEVCDSLDSTAKDRLLVALQSSLRRVRTGKWLSTRALNDAVSENPYKRCVSAVAHIAGCLSMAASGCPKSKTDALQMFPRLTWICASADAGLGPPTSPGLASIETCVRDATNVLEVALQHPGFKDSTAAMGAEQVRQAKHELVCAMRSVLRCHARASALELARVQLSDFLQSSHAAGSPVKSRASRKDSGLDSTGSPGKVAQQLMQLGMGRLGLRSPFTRLETICPGVLRESLSPATIWRELPQGRAPLPAALHAFVARYGLCFRLPAVKSAMAPSSDRLPILQCYRSMIASGGQISQISDIDAAADASVAVALDGLQGQADAVSQLQLAAIRHVWWTGRDESMLLAATKSGSDPQTRLRSVQQWCTTLTELFSTATRLSADDSTRAAAFMAGQALPVLLESGIAAKWVRESARLLVGCTGTCDLKQTLGWGKNAASLHVFLRSSEPRDAHSAALCMEHTFGMAGACLITVALLSAGQLHQCCQSMTQVLQEGVPSLAAGKASECSPATIVGVSMVCLHSLASLVGHDTASTVPLVAMQMARNHARVDEQVILQDAGAPIGLMSAHELWTRAAAMAADQSLVQQIACRSVGATLHMSIAGAIQLAASAIRQRTVVPWTSPSAISATALGVQSNTELNFLSWARLSQTRDVRALAIPRECVRAIRCGFVPRTPRLPQNDRFGLQCAASQIEASRCIKEHVAEIVQEEMTSFSFLSDPRSLLGRLAAVGAHVGVLRASARSSSSAGAAARSAAGSSSPPDLVLPEHILHVKLSASAVAGLAAQLFAIDSGKLLLPQTLGALLAGHGSAASRRLLWNVVRLVFPKASSRHDLLVQWYSSVLRYLSERLGAAQLSGSDELQSRAQCGLEALAGALLQSSLLRCGVGVPARRMLEAFGLQPVPSVSSVASSKNTTEGSRGEGRRKQESAATRGISSPPTKRSRRKSDSKGKGGSSSASLAAYLTQKPMEEEESSKVADTSALDGAVDGDEDNSFLAQDLDALAYIGERGNGSEDAVTLRQAALKQLLQRYFLYIFVKHLSSRLHDESSPKVRQKLAIHSVCGLLRLAFSSQAAQQSHAVLSLFKHVVRRSLHSKNSAVGVAALGGIQELWSMLPTAHQRDVAPAFAAAVLPALHGGAGGLRSAQQQLRPYAEQLLRQVVGVSAAPASGAGRHGSDASGSDLAVVLPRPTGQLSSSIEWPFQLSSEATPDRLLRFALQLRQGEEEIVLAALQQLETFLSARADDVAELALGTSVAAQGLVHRSVPILIASLFGVVARLQSRGVLAATGQCLGALGAISPASLAGDDGFASEFKSPQKAAILTGGDEHDSMQDAAGASADGADPSTDSQSHSQASSGHHSQPVSPEVVRNVFSGKTASGTEAVAAMWKRGQFSPVYKHELSDAQAGLRTGTKASDDGAVSTQVLPTSILRGRSGTQEYGLQSAAVSLIDSLLAATVRAAHSSVEHSCAAYATQEVLRVLGRLHGLKPFSSLTAARQLESKREIAKRVPGVQRLFGQDVQTAEEEARFPFRLRLYFSKDVLATILPFWQSDYLETGSGHINYSEAVWELFPGMRPQTAARRTASPSRPAASAGSAEPQLKGRSAAAGKQGYTGENFVGESLGRALARGSSIFDWMENRNERTADPLQRWLQTWCRVLLEAYGFSCQWRGHWARLARSLRQVVVRIDAAARVVLPLAAVLVASRCPEAVGRRLVQQEIVGRLEAVAAQGIIGRVGLRARPNSSASRSVLVAAARIALDSVGILRGVSNSADGEGSNETHSRGSKQAVRMPDADVRPGTVIARGTGNSGSSSKSNGAAGGDGSVRAWDVWFDENDFDDEDEAVQVGEESRENGGAFESINPDGGLNLVESIPRLTVARAAAEVHQLGWAIREIEQELRNKSGQFGGSARVGAAEEDDDQAASSSSSSSSKAGIVSKSGGDKKGRSSERSFAEDGLGGLVWGDMPYDRRDLAELQQAYAKVDDPDGLHGVSALRSRLVLDSDESAGGGASQDAVSSGNEKAGGSGGRGQKKQQEPMLSSDEVEIVEIGGRPVASLDERARELRTATQTATAVMVAGGLSSIGAGDIDDLEDGHSQRHETEMLLGIQERLLDAVHGARWHDAIVLHEQALGIVRSMRHGLLAACVRSMSEEQLEAGLMACLSAAGHQETALRRAQGLLGRDSSASVQGIEAVVRPAAIDSSWRLGKWSSLSSLLRMREGQPTIYQHGLGMGFAAPFGEALLSLRSASLATRQSSSFGAFDATGIQFGVKSPGILRTQAGVPSSGSGLLGSIRSLASDTLRSHRPSQAVVEVPSSSDAVNLALLSGARGRGLPQLQDLAAVAGQESRVSILEAAMAVSSLRKAESIDRGAKAGFQLEVPGPGAAPADETRAAAERLLLRGISAGSSSASASLDASLAQRGGSGQQLQIPEALLLQFTSAATPAFLRCCDTLSDSLAEARVAVGKRLAEDSPAGYEACYPHLVKLHLLRDLELSARTLLEPSKPKRLQLFQQLLPERRMDVLRQDLETVEPVLALQRTLLQCLLGDRQLVGESWLKLAKVARQNGRFATADAALQHATGLGNPRARLHRAKLLYMQGRTLAALQEIEPVEISHGRLHERAVTIQGAAARHLESRRILHATSWMIEADRVSSRIDERYQAAMKMTARRDKIYFKMGLWFDQCLQRLMERADAVSLRRGSMAEAQKGRSSSSSSSAGSRAAAATSLEIEALHRQRDELVFLAVNMYAKALRLGEHRFVYQALPRLLTLVFDYGAAVQRAHDSSGRGGASGGGGSSGSSGAVTLSQMRSSDEIRSRSARMGDARQDTLDRLVRRIGTLRDNLPGFLWVLAMPQLVSRLCHRNPQVISIMFDVMKSITYTYHREALWMVTGLTKSRVAIRKQRGERICQAVRRASSTHQRSVDTYGSLFSDLVRAAQQKPKDSKAKSMTVRVGNSRQFRAVPVLLPTQDALMVRLPSATKRGSSPNLARVVHGFPADGVRPTIDQFESKARVMSSKEKPKQLTAVGSDGRRYRFLCKQELSGDLRKDARMMEHSTVVNRLLAADHEASRRALRLRTYSVVVTSESTGLMEWVDSCTPLRFAVREVYSDLGVESPMQLTLRVMRAVQKQQDDTRQTTAATAQFFASEVQPQFPAVLHRYHLKRFADPARWLRARQRFTRSTACWGMVGHLLGLGDRHGENLLMDDAGGEQVHVDFDCLFDKGLSLSRPEVVPFRLTANVLDAMGLWGYEGGMRRSSEACMAVLRGNSSTLLGVLESFVYDPLVEWTRSKSGSKRGGGGSRAAAAAIVPTDEVPGTAVGGEVENLAGVTIVRHIKERLRGGYNVRPPHREKYNVRTKRHASADAGRLADGRTIGVQAQVHRLIAEASSVENLAQMYVGWMPFL